MTSVDSAENRTAKRTRTSRKGTGLTDAYDSLLA